MNTMEYLNVLKQLAVEGKEMGMLVTGNSMAPFLIHGRDTIYFTAVKNKLKVGDMVFFQRKTGQYVMHRICKIQKNGIYVVGDNQTEVEGPLEQEQIFAVVTKVKRNGEIVDTTNFWWWFYARIWSRIIPFRKIICRVYRVFQKRKGSMIGKGNRTKACNDARCRGNLSDYENSI